MIALYQEIIYRPLLNTMVFFYNTIAFHDLGVAIIFLTIVIRLVLYPLFHKSTKHQMVMQRLQPHVKKIQETHKNDREKQTKAMMDLYREHGINPFSGFLLLFVQLLFLIPLFSIFRNIGSDLSPSLYPFVHSPGILNPIFLGLIDIGKANYVLLAVAVVVQYIQGRMILPPKNPDEKQSGQDMARTMVYIAPVITVVIFYRLPAALILYMIVMSLFSIGHQVIIHRELAKNPKIS